MSWPRRATHDPDNLQSLDARTHEIRRAVASTMLLSGTPIHVVKEILGHSTLKTTELYAFAPEEARRDASKRGILKRPRSVPQSYSRTCSQVYLGP